jgi:hypothetical protein
MERLLARMERRIGKLAIPRLPFVIAVTSAVVYALHMLRPGFMMQLLLIPQLVMTGQVWRVITWVFVPPPSGNIFWTAIAILFYLSLGNTLEQEWGAFKLNVYYFVGIVGTVIASLALGLPMSSEYLHSTILFAFATLFPNVQFLLFFIVPIRAKWSALIAAGFILYQAYSGTMSDRIAIGIALGNYLLFFAPTLLALARGAAVVAKQERRRAEIFDDEEDKGTRPERKCKICGLTDADPGADLRVCTCQEVCGGKATVYCLPHARSHNKPAEPVS